MIPDKRVTSTVGLTVDEVKKICRGIAPKDREKQMLCVVEEELTQGFEFIKQFPHMVTILGSARTKEGDPYYDKARDLAFRLTEQYGFTITTGGGPGIMEAANRGAREAGGKSIGIGIKLPSEQQFNSYVTESMNFHFFFTRKVIMTYSAKGFVYFPGGYGTLDEFFEFLTLVQTHKMPPMPMYLFGSDYWAPLMEFIKTHCAAFHYIDTWDENLFSITDNIDDVVEGIHHFING